jgi:hypothetical protein
MMTSTEKICKDIIIILKQIEHSDCLLIKELYSFNSTLKVVKEDICINKFGIIINRHDNINIKSMVNINSSAIAVLFLCQLVNFLSKNF